ncbi:uncharacterized protein LOC116847527 [Odontomachus brunneus]|uniref:uncharacterized protein LOC116847527 n=1 Tax=Odontomachus brunneus TaxID=486640 RepID=UPI0013F1BA01|nr:uncharacterized protein LOC116847527 [Odontomachus brunneus]
MFMRPDSRRPWTHRRAKPNQSTRVSPHEAPVFFFFFSSFFSPCFFFFFFYEKESLLVLNLPSGDPLRAGYEPDFARIRFCLPLSSYPSFCVISTRTIDEACETLPVKLQAFAASMHIRLYFWL